MSKNKLKITDVKAGDILYPDDGFCCMERNKPYLVYDSRNGCYLKCTEDKHFLDGQCSFADSETLVGLSRTPWPDRTK